MRVQEGPGEEKENWKGLIHHATITKDNLVEGKGFPMGRLQRLWQSAAVAVIVS